MVLWLFSNLIISSFFDSFKPLVMSTRPTFMSLGGILQLFRMWEHIQLQPSSCTEIHSGLLKVCLQWLSRICFIKKLFMKNFNSKIIHFKPFNVYYLFQFSIEKPFVSYQKIVDLLCRLAFTCLYTLPLPKLTCIYKI